MTVDELPKVVTSEKLDYKLLMQEHLTKNGKAIKPVKRRNESQTIDPAIHCSYCQAPSDYLYLNNGRAQDNRYQCKICHNLFNHKN